MTVSQIVGAFQSLTRTRVFASGRYHYGSVETAPNDTLVGKTYCPTSLLSSRFRQICLPRLRVPEPKTRTQIQALATTGNLAFGESAKSILEDGVANFVS